MKRCLLFSIILIALSTKNLLAQTVTSSANPSTLNLAVSNQVTLSATISSSMFTTNNTSWADPGSGVSVGATSFSGGNTMATATATISTTGSRTFALNYRRSGSNSNFSSTVNVNVVDLDITSSATQSINTGGYVDFDYGSRSGFPNTGNYFYSWQVNKTGGIAASDISYISSTSATNSSPRIQFNTAGTYSVALTVTRNGVSATSPATTVTVIAPPPGTKAFNTPIYSANFKGGHTVFGNTIMAVYSNGNGNNGGTINTSATNNHANMQFVNVDYAAGNSQGVQSASSANLKLPAGTNTIKFARLYWGGRITNSQIQGGGNYTSFRSVKIRKGSSGAYTTLNVPLSQVNTTSVYGSSPAATAYQSWADVTSLIQSGGAGTYTVADIAASVGQTSDDYGNYAGWSIVVVYENPALDYFATRIYDAFIQVANSASQTVTLTGFDAPTNALQQNEAYLTAFTWEGDPAYDGDYLKINNITFSNSLNPSNNMWNGSISEAAGGSNANLVMTRTPNLNSSLAVDIDQVLVGTGYGINPNATSVSVQFGTNEDQYFPSILAFSMKVKDPQLTISKKAVDNNDQEIISLKANQSFTYVISGKNMGNGDAANTFVIDHLPDGITYIPGSLKIVKGGTGGVIGTMSEASGDDKAVYVPAAGGQKAYIKFFLGSGASNTAGGVLKPNDEYEVRFKVATSANVNELVVINIGYVSTFSNVLNQAVTLQATSSLSGPQDAPLAISLLSFTAVKQNGDALLKWTTEGEKDNDHFDIERSIDGINFSKVGVVAGSNTISSRQNYHFLDPLTGLTGVVYYRLKDVDTYGKGTYSKIIALHLSGSISETKAAVYPNPFVDNIKVSVQSSKQEEVTVRILSLSGQEIMSKKLSVQAGQNIIVLSDVQKLKTGAHVLQLITKEGTVSQKIIKK